MTMQLGGLRAALNGQKRFKFKVSERLCARLSSQVIILLTLTGPGSAQPPEGAVDHLVIGGGRSAL